MRKRTGGRSLVSELEVMDELLARAIQAYYVPRRREGAIADQPNISDSSTALPRLQKAAALPRWAETSRRARPHAVFRRSGLRKRARSGAGIDAAPVAGRGRGRAAGAERGRRRVAIRAPVGISMTVYGLATAAITSWR